VTSQRMRTFRLNSWVSAMATCSPARSYWSWLWPRIL